jgi:hypothetical protein
VTLEPTTHVFTDAKETKNVKFIVRAWKTKLKIQFELIKNQNEKKTRGL